MKILIIFFLIIIKFNFANSVETIAAQGILYDYETKSSIFEKNINELNIFKTKVNNLNKGTYLLTIIRDNKKETKQIIIK